MHQAYSQMTTITRSVYLKTKTFRFCGTGAETRTLPAVYSKCMQLELSLAKFKSIWKYILPIMSLPIWLFQSWQFLRIPYIPITGLLGLFVIGFVADLLVIPLCRHIYITMCFILKSWMTNIGNKQLVVTPMQVGCIVWVCKLWVSLITSPLLNIIDTLHDGGTFLGNSRLWCHDSCDCH